MIPFGPAFWCKEIADLEQSLAECRRLRHNAPFIRQPKRRLAEQLAQLDEMIAKYEDWIAQHRALLAEHGEAA